MFISIIMNKDVKRWGKFCERLDERITENMWGHEDKPAFGDLPITYRQLQNLLWMHYVPDNKLLRRILPRAGVSDWEEVNKYSNAASLARQTLRIITYDGQILPPSPSNVPKQRKIYTHPAGTTLSELAYEYSTSSRTLSREINKILSLTPEEDWHQKIKIISRQKPMQKTLIVLPLLIKQLEEKKILRELTAPPRTWVPLNVLRKMFTDSNVIMRERIDAAVTLLQQRGEARESLICYAHNRRRDFVPFYSPKLLEFMRNEMKISTHEQRSELPIAPDGYITFTECVQRTGMDYHFIRKKAAAHRDALPEDERKDVIIEGRGKGGVKTLFFKASELETMRKNGEFVAQEKYFSYPEPPEGWLSSSGLYEKYKGNKGKMIQVANAFQKAAEGDEYMSIQVGHYRRNSKVGIFLSPVALEALEKGYKGLKLERA